ncbi:hypothetical protein ACIG0C_25010 [Kitasatospora aureofaciens]|uniref:Uncharacterized protein n=1 Tax=Kitasatospora aureofaciens TaxID=1894 RepID=A0A1E7NBP0_KITAU|nr:hypothetical protein [Kitasatospora aureofaciens]QEV00908.1 hypothetical protein CP971_18105 [Streptomyces viridifaciens]ARF79683.1 hypothetical protein B6264_12905 [Kitasatospora aureofaciens]OEV38110.1 hypothetical protein HS99_0023200 [Kitasatospora aureofaciens]UKZ07227.1 hypothetical protein BOQ63_024995 [Streptomyces viridifaciens]GGU87702.1 hypothetical protein GCM10010502_45330 [Kitasatospora aureofaciens]
MGYSAFQSRSELTRSERSAAATARAARAAREFLHTALRDGLRSLTLLVLADAGQARREPSWGEPARLSLPHGVQDGLTAALGAAVTDTPDTAPLCTLLRCAGPSTAV